MALIKCKKCGHPISDKAIVCPKCGAKNIVDKIQSFGEEASLPRAENTTNKQVEKITETNIELSKKQKFPYLFLILTVLAILGGCMGYFLYTDHQNKVAEARFQEQQRQDSIAAVQLEAVRLDSIRQDSIEFINFSTSDLTFFELHGKVKSVYYDSLYEAVAEIFNNSYFEFDENGNLMNKRNNFKLEEPDGEYLYRWEYNENGFPTKGVFAENGGYPTEYWVWNPNGQLKKAYYSYGSHFVETNYKYDKDGRLVLINYLERGNMGVEVIRNTKVEIVETDKWGNWLTRILNEKVSDKYDAINDDVLPDDGYQVVRHNGYRTFEKKYTKKITEKRTITYYDNR